jgi:vanillate O-demethylase ferredoxin subunit
VLTIAPGLFLTKLLYALPEDVQQSLAASIPFPKRLGKPGKHLYVCGPAGFIGAVLETAAAAGWDERKLHREYFAASPQPEAASDGFQIKLASSGRVIDVKGEQTVIAALTSAGVEVPTSCEQGVCGTCLTRVLAGEPDHRDVYLTDDERAAKDCFLPCCSRSKSPILVLDL